MRPTNLTRVLSIVGFEVATGPTLVGFFNTLGKSLITQNTSGGQDLYPKLTGSDQPLLNLDYWEFEPKHR